MGKVISLEQYKNDRAQKHITVSCGRGARQELADKICAGMGISPSDQKENKKKDIQERNADVLRQMRIEEDDSW